MTWLKVDDGFDVDRRVQGLSLDARGLLVSAATYSARNLLDGRIEGKWLRREARHKRRRERIMGELVEAGLIEWMEGDGFEVIPLHDDAEHLLHAFTRAEVEERRRYEADKKRKQRKGDAAATRTRNGSVPPGHPGDSLVRPRSGRPGVESGGESTQVAENGTVAEQERAEAEAARVREKFGPSC